MTPRLLAALLPCCGLFGQTWVHLDGAAFSGRSAAFDWARGRLVMRGYEGATWEFANSELLHRPYFGPGPSPRGRSAMAFDLQRRRILLFGGVDFANTSLNDTWAWDGVRWTQLPGIGPSPRGDAAMTYDIARDRMVLFGGQAPWVGSYADTWEHDGTQWLQCTPATPALGNSPVLAYDFIRQRSVLVTHQGLFNTPVSTWEWDGTDWTLRSQSGPLTTSSQGLAFDWSRLTCVMVGGVNSNQTIWEWNGSTWTSHPTPGMPARLMPAVYFHPVRGRLCFTGGYDFLMNQATVLQGSARTDTWEWNGSNCTLVHDDHRPPARHGHAFVAGPGHQMLFGGVRQQAVVQETWTWHGNRWQRRTPSNSPSARRSATGCYDVQRQQALLFGGFANGNTMRDLWAWNGSNWLLLDSGTGPGTRSSAALANDPQTGNTLLFGGASYSLAAPSWVMRNDTWRWNGTSWLQLAPAVSPSPREGSAMAHHPANGTALLFGGRVGATLNDQLQDTWLWTGTTWQAQAPVLVPPALGTPSMNWDPTRAGFVLTGTRLDLVTSVANVETWLWQNQNWTMLDSTISRELTGPVVFDAVRQRLLVTNGSTLAELATTPAVMQNYGSGCGATPPALTVRTRARTGDLGFGLECPVQPLEPLVYAFGTAQTQLAVGNGCTVWIANIAAMVAATADSYGMSELPVPIPANHSLRGLVYYAQTAVLDPSAPGGFRLSQGVRVVLGD